MDANDMTLDEFGRVLAWTQFFTGHREEVLARLRIDRAQFESATTKHTRALTEATSRDDIDTLQRFGTAYAGATRECREGRQTLEALGPEPAPTAPDPHTALPIDETGMMVPSHELQQLIREAEPRFAMANAARSSAGEPRPVRPSPPSAEESGETAIMPAPEEIQRLIREAEPKRAISSGASATAPPPDLSLDQYAVIRATTQLRPAETDAVWARYGVQPADRSRVEAAMLRQISATPEGARQFSERFQHFMGYLASNASTPRSTA